MSTIRMDGASKRVSNCTGRCLGNLAENGPYEQIIEELLDSVVLSPRSITYNVVTVYAICKS